MPGTGRGRRRETPVRLMVSKRRISIARHAIDITIRSHVSSIDPAGMHAQIPERPLNLDRRGARLDVREIGRSPRARVSARLTTPAWQVPTLADGGTPGKYLHLISLTSNIITLTSLLARYDWGQASVPLPWMSTVTGNVVVDVVCRILQHVGVYGWASSARASLDERARSRRQDREPRDSGGGAERRALTPASTRARCWSDDAAGTTTSCGRRDSKTPRIIDRANNSSALRFESLHFPPRPARRVRMLAKQVSSTRILLKIRGFLCWQPAFQTAGHIGTRRAISPILAGDSEAAGQHESQATPLDLWLPPSEPDCRRTGCGSSRPVCRTPRVRGQCGIRQSLPSASL